jgi:hypothetical protein
MEFFFSAPASSPFMQCSKLQPFLRVVLGSSAQDYLSLASGERSTELGRGRSHREAGVHHDAWFHHLHDVED